MATNNPVTLSYVEALLESEGIAYLVLDRNMSILEGSIGVIPRRVMVEDDALSAARTLITNAGMGKELTTHRDGARR